MNDIKLRKLLWDTMESWYKTVAEWFEADYLTLDVEDMNTFTAKCVKNVTQLEKGLPRNLIVPKLKEDIATVKDKVKQIFSITSILNSVQIKFLNIVTRCGLFEKFVFTATALAENRISLESQV